MATTSRDVGRDRMSLAGRGAESTEVQFPAGVEQAVIPSFADQAACKDQERNVQNSLALFPKLKFKNHDAQDGARTAAKEGRQLARVDFKSKEW